MEYAADVSAVATEVSKTSADMYSRLVLILGLGVVGFLGRMLFMVFGPRVSGFNPFRTMSGAGMLIVAVLMVLGAVVAAGKGGKAVRLVQGGIVDQYKISVLGQDSCDVETGDYCVIVFEDGREIVVNWFDRRVNMFDIAHPIQGAVASSKRPHAVDRPAEPDAA